MGKTAEDNEELDRIRQQRNEERAEEQANGESAENETEEQQAEETPSGAGVPKAAAPSQAGGDSQTGGESQTGGGNGQQNTAQPAQSPALDERTKALYDELTEDEHRINDIIDKMLAYSDTVEYATSKGKQKSVRRKLHENLRVIKSVRSNVSKRYPKALIEIPQKNYSEGSKRVQKIANHVEAAMNLYRKHKQTLASVEKEMVLYDFDNRLTELNNERREYKYDKGEINYHQYRSLRYRFEDMVAEYKTLPVPESPAGKDLKKRIEGHIERETKYLKWMEAYMPEEDKAKMKGKEQEANEVADFMNKHYSSSSPLIRLLYKVKAVRGVQPAAKTTGQKIKGAASSVKEKYDVFSELKEGYDDTKEAWEKHKDWRNPTEEEEEDGALVTWLKEHAKEALAWLVGKFGGDEKAQDISGEVLEELADWFEPLVSAGKLLINMKSFVSSVADMSWEEAKQQASEILGNSIELTLDTLGKLFEKLKIIPLFGQIAELVKGAVGVVQHVITFIDKRKHRNEASSMKEGIKERMLEKRDKYAQMEDIKDEELYGFMGTSTVSHGFLWRKKREETHVAKASSKEKWHKKYDGETTTTIDKQRAKLESAVGGDDVNLYEQLEEMKGKKDRDQLSAEERKKYYQMKTLRDIREFTEQKEDVKVNRKRMRAEGWEIAHNGLDIVAAISGFFPGYGTAVATGISFFNATAKFAHTAVSKARGFIQSQNGTAAAKDAKRSAMANNIFNQMVYITGFMRPDMNDNSTPLFALGPGTAGRVSKSMDYISSTTATLSYKMSEMQEAKDQESLIDMMASAFSTEG